MKKIFLVVFSFASFSGLWASEFDDALHQALESQNANYSSEKNKELWIGRAIHLGATIGHVFTRLPFDLPVLIMNHYSSKRFFEEKLSTLSVSEQVRLKQLALSEGAPNTLGFLLKLKMLGMVGLLAMGGTSMLTENHLALNAAVFLPLLFFYKKMSMNRAAKTAACQLNVSID